MAEIMQKANAQAFHSYLPSYVDYPVWLYTTTVDRTLAYRFSPHLHPYVRDLIHALVEGSVDGLQAADTDYRRTAADVIETLPAPDGRPYPTLYDQLFTAASYHPTSLVDPDYPVKELDFSSRGAYSVYNWELFYHVPITIAMHLTQNGQFADAERWLRYIFDPTDASADPAPMKFWKVRPFSDMTVRSIEDILTNLSTQADPQLFQDTVASIEAWKASPFRPHLVARYRQSAYMYKAVMAYLDNCIAWGDSAFMLDTGESVNEATQMYVLAAHILGPRPQEVPQKGWQRAKSYEDLRPDLDAFGNALTALELDVPFNLLPQPTAATDGGALNSIASIGTALYFCVPRNDKLLSYWDTVADRLFKIRNSLNIQGVFRRLPLFEPPIDPALLAKAVAAGVDIGAAIAGLNQPLPLVRFAVLTQKATEICQNVISLGSHMLSAIERQDAETLSVLRSQYETATLQATELVRYGAWQEALKATDAIEATFGAALARYTYYEQQLGRDPSDISIPGLDALDIAAMRRYTYTSDESTPKPRTVPVDIASDLTSADGKHISSYERSELDHIADAQSSHSSASDTDKTGAGLALVPTFGARFQPFGTGGTITFGGGNLAAAANLVGAFFRADAEASNTQAVQASRIGGYARRDMESTFQSNAALAEMGQTLKQWRAAQIHAAMAEQEYHNVQAQIVTAQQIDTYLSGEKTTTGLAKTTTADLYAWLSRQVRGLYNQSFQLAYDVARKAERALQFEIGDASQSFLQTGYTSGREGLLAGEGLMLDLKRMESAYLDLNQREYELTKHVSLRQIDPVALLTLRATGTCSVTLPEGLFDLDCPGHYFRRIRSVAVSIPSVVGPYSGLNCTLTLQQSCVRTSPQLINGGYSRNGDDAGRFSDYFGRIESIVTSSGTNDTGLFETNLHDERYLPFEGSGAVSQWTLQLPANIRQFDYASISDVVLRLRYTAREGGAPLRAAAEKALQAQIKAATTVGSVRMLSLRRDFPTEWAKFAATDLTASPRAPYTLTLREEHYPFWAVPKTMKLHKIQLFAAPGAKTTITVTADQAGTQPVVTLTAAGAPNGLVFGTVPQTVAPPAAIGPVTWYLDDNTMEDAWVALTWGET